MQRGTITKSHGAWYLRWYENGKRVTKRLGSTEEYPTQRSVEPLAHDLMREVNRSSEPGTTLDSFIETRYLSYVRDNLRLSTHTSYQNLWSVHISDREEAQLRVREYTTYSVQCLLDSIAADKSLTGSSLQHIKHFLSGAFRFAAQCGIRESNPVRECRIPKTQKKSAETYAYNLDEIRRTLGVLPIHLKAAVAVAAFSGLRLGEIVGLEWNDVTKDEITVRRSVWRDQTNPPKSKASANYVPMIPALYSILNQYRATAKGKSRVFPFSLDAAGKRDVSKSMESVGLKWYGWHAFRRGVASNLYALGCDDLIVQRVLRHSKVTVTREHYIQHRDPKLQEAMERLERAFDMTSKTVQ
jgi:integrase